APNTRDSARLRVRSPSRNATTTGRVDLAVCKSRGRTGEHSARPLSVHKPEQNAPSRKPGRPDRQNCLAGLVLIRLTNSTYQCVQRCHEHPDWPAVTD